MSTEFTLNDLQGLFLLLPRITELDETEMRQIINDLDTYLPSDYTALSVLLITMSTKKSMRTKKTFLPDVYKHIFAIYLSQPHQQLARNPNPSAGAGLSDFYEKLQKTLINKIIIKMKFMF